MATTPVLCIVLHGAFDPGRTGGQITTSNSEGDANFDDIPLQLNRFRI